MRGQGGEEEDVDWEWQQEEPKGCGMVGSRKGVTMG